MLTAGEKRNPRILIVTPEITYLPKGMGNLSNRMRAKAGGLADVSASLVAALYRLGADVHVALPNYRRMFHMDMHDLTQEELDTYRSTLNAERIHLAEDRVFHYRSRVYSSYVKDSHKISLAFQREVINNILPRVQPDLIHCNDWMTGLIPASARWFNIPSLFTLHNIHTQEMTLEQIEDMGIDAADFWTNLYYGTVPESYESTRSTVPIDMLTSGIFASHFINTVSPTFLQEIVDGVHDFVPEQVRREVAFKQKAGCAKGILNAPDAEFDPATDDALAARYNAETVVDGKRANKAVLQERLAMAVDPDAPLLLWPSRLDPVQKGCQLLTEILYDLINSYWDQKLQIAVIANGDYQRHFLEIVEHHGLQSRIGVVDFDESLSHLGFAAADFMLMPSRFEPCGLPQMISPIYGTLPIVHDTGGIHDTVTHLSQDGETGNGFVFGVYDGDGLRWAIDQAMAFHSRPKALRTPVIQRVMTEAKACFNHSVTAQAYIDLYETMIDRPLVKGK
ncbi:MAG: glycogen/starch synthase [Lentisphaeria bacterium]|nr:glycogen/starch synthase [Lentisphaeria bacterium]